MRTERGSGAGFSGGSGGAGGYRFQALAVAYVYAHALAEHGLNWVSGGAIPLAISTETAGPGDDLRVEYLDGSGAASGVLEVQAKRGLNRGSELWDALMSLARGLDENSSLRCALLVDHAASRPVKDELRRDIERLAQGRSDRLRPITREFLRSLEAEGITPRRSLLTRLSVVVADLGDRSEGEGAALVLLSNVVDKASILNAWTAFREDGMRLAEIAGRRDVPALWDMLEAHGIKATVGGESLLSQREDQVPPYPRPFVGRDAVVGDISALLSAAGDGSRPVVAVRGLPGSGKSAVATAVAEGLRSTFPGGVLWGSVGPNPSPLSVLARWGRALGTPDLEGYQDVGAASARMKAVLRERKTLLVLDDIWGVEHARHFEVGGPQSATLATTRSRVTALGITPGGTVIELEPLTEADAVSLLEQLAPSLDHDDQGRLDELAVKLGRLPLALRVAGRLLEEEAMLGLGVSDLLGELEQGEKLLSAAVPPDLSNLVETTTPTVAALLERSTEALEESERKCFARLGAFEPGPASFDLPAAGTVWSDTGEQITRALIGTLIGRGLVDSDGSGRFSLHPVLSMHARHLLQREADGGREARFLHATHYLGVLRSAEALYNAGGEARKVGLALFDTEWENIRVGQLWAASRLAEAEEDTEAARLVSNYADHGWWLLSMRATVEERSHWIEDALKAHGVLMDVSNSGAGKERPEETRRTQQAARARNLHGLALVRNQAGRTDEAFALEREAGEIYRSLGNRLGESTVHNGLGVLYTARGDYELAEQSYFRALDLLRKELDAKAGKSTRSIPYGRRAGILGNLGALYRHMGRAQLADEVIGEAIAIFRRQGDMVQVGIALNNRGSLRSELREDKRGARRDFLAARRIFRDLGSRIDEAISVLALGREHAYAKEYRRAERRAREVITVTRELGDLSLEGWGLALLGDARLGLGYPAEAEGIYHEVLDAARRMQNKRLESMASEGLENAARAQKDN